MKRDAWYQGRMFSGMDFFAWLRLLARNRFAVSPSRLPTAAAITVCAAANTTLRAIQNLRFARQVAGVQIATDPIFIIGHWRTGTTMLQELLALDPRHRCPTTYECLVPNHFLISERFLRRWLWFMLPSKRPMDNMRMSFDRPQEDEAALCNLGVPSPLLTVAFPNHPLQYPRYVELDDLTPAELQRWQRALRRFLQQVLFKRSGRLVLKSPRHTSRLRVLSRMFPNAHFVHLVRDPYVVFPSTVHFWTVMYATQGLQRPKLDTLNDYVFDTLVAMYRKLDQTRGLIDPGRFYELRYEDLVRDPVGQLRVMYEYFQWREFDAVEPAIRRYARRSKRYQTNRFDLTPELCDEISNRWAPYIEKYGCP